MPATRYVTGAPNWIDLGTPDIEGAAAFYHHLFGRRFRSADPTSAATASSSSTAAPPRPVCRTHRNRARRPGAAASACRSRPSVSGTLPGGACPDTVRSVVTS